MQTIDPALQKAVWARVLGTAPAPAEATPPAAELLQFLTDKRVGFEIYRKLSRRLWGRNAALLRNIAEEERAHFYSLHAAYYAETGRRAELPPDQPSRLPPLPEAVLSARNRENSTARAYEEAAKRWPSLSDGFRAMAEDERRHARLLNGLLGRLL